MSNKTILVTGGAGYIGSHFCKEAYKNGYNVVVFDNLSTGKKEFVKWGELIVGDLNDYNLIVKTLNTYKPVCVVHFAASIEVGESVKNPAKYYKNNVINTLNLLKAMNECNIKNIVFSSTASIFYVPDGSKINENATKLPQNPYAKTKLMVENILEDFAIAYDLKYTCLRYFNASGADPDGELGETHFPPNHLITIVLDNYKNNKITKIFGNNYPTKDGTCIRDYVHVSDLATAHILAIEKMLETRQSVKINLGTGNGYSVLEIIKATENVLNTKVNYEIVDRRVGDPACLICDNSFAKEYLGWTPKYLNVEEHISHAWGWMNKK